MMIQFGSSTSVQPVAFSPPGVETSSGDWLYKQAVKAYQRPDRWKKKSQEMMDAADGQSLFQKGFTRARASLLRFATQWIKYDYSQQSPVKMGKFRFNVINIPRGPLLLLLYLCTIPPRTWLAYKRGEKDNDYREVGDVLRRDILTITMFIFAHELVGKAMAKITQKRRKVRLIDSQTGDMLNYSQFSNYRIDSLQTLKAIMREGNDKGLHAAVQALHDHGLSLRTGDQRFKEALDHLKQQMSHLSTMPQSVEGSATDVARDRQIVKVFEAFQKAEKIREMVRLDVLTQGTHDGMKLAEALGDKVTHVLERYAKRSRLPSDMISFAFVAILIGWFPVWFNATWNRFRFLHKRDGAGNALPAQVPQPTTVQAQFSPMSA